MSVLVNKKGEVLAGLVPSEEDIEVTWNAKLIGRAGLRSAKRIGNLVFVTCQSNVSAQIDTSEVIVSGLPNGAAEIINFVSASADSFPNGLNMFYLTNGNVYSRQNVSYLFLNLVYVASE